MSLRCAIRRLIPLVFAGVLLATGLQTPASAQGSAWPRTIRHAAGETTLSAPARRVVALEWTNQLSNHPVWRNLRFVKEGRTYPIGGDTWLFGGPLSAEVLLQRVIDALMR